jgi:hypothetical protein
VSGAAKISFADAVQLDAMVEPDAGEPDMPRLLTELNALGVPLWTIVEHDMYPAPAGQTLRVATSTCRYYRATACAPIGAEHESVNADCTIRERRRSRRNGVKLGWSNRLLARSEVSAAVGRGGHPDLLLDRGAVVPFAGVVLHRAVPGVHDRDRGSRVGMLMIGGEFDLSAGMIVTSAGFFNALFCTTWWHRPDRRRHLVVAVLPGDRVLQRLHGDADRHPQLLDHPR